MSKPKRHFRKGEVLTVEITGYAFGGKGIAKIQIEEGEFVVFVQNAFPGQTVEARVVKSKKRFAECKLDKVIHRSPDEIETDFQAIPGAPYATLPIEKQVELKRTSATELYKRIGQIENIEDTFDTYIQSPLDWHYRNKMEYSFSGIRFDLAEEEMKDDFGLGFKHRGTWWAVENLDKDSGLFDAQVENDLHKVRAFCEDSGLPAWHPPKRVGFFRYFVVRKSFEADKLLVNLVTSSDGLDGFDRDGFIELLKSLWGERLGGVLHSINDATGDRVEATEGHSSLIYGEEKVVEKLNGLDFEIDMKSFFQTNPKSAELLYKKAIGYALEKEEEGAIMDLFCGTGTIAQLIAQNTSKEVIGVDIVANAVKDAKANAKRNGVSTTKFFASDVGKFLLEYPEYKGKIGTIVLDPPRGGIAPKTLRKVMRLEAPRIVYISCNPATQARDAKDMAEAGYELKKWCLVEQFPHTAHVEAIALFEKS